MYQYEFESVSIEFSDIGMIRGNRYEMDNYRKIIEKRAADGWRLVTMIPKVQRGMGFIEVMDLVFEKETKQ